MMVRRKLKKKGLTSGEPGTKNAKAEIIVRRIPNDWPRNTANFFSSGIFQPKILAHCWGMKIKGRPYPTTMATPTMYKYKFE
jgi:hypothetical protein